MGFLDSVAAVPALRDAKREATLALCLQAGDRVLDVGCGTGVDLADMAESTRPGGSVVGIDPSARAIEVAAARLSGTAGVSVQVADAYDLPFGDGSFDAARADRVVLHLERPEEALIEIRRVLSAHGRLLVLETWASLQGRDGTLDDPAHRMLVGAMWDTGEKATGIQLFLPLLLARAGFGAPIVEEGVAQSHEFADACTMLRLLSSASETVASGRISNTRASAWLSRLESAMAKGAVVLTVGHVRLVAPVA